MTETQAVILGILQGAGEFLPVSSSAHLALAPRVFGWPYQGLAYDVMLHLGTLLAVMIYFWRDWLKIFSDAVKRPAEKEGRLLWLLAAGTVPGALAGLFLNDMAETTFRNPLWIGFNLLFFSIIIFIADRKPAQTLGEDSFSLKHAVIIGLAQSVALMPGASRSGMTIMAALFLGYTRGEAARLSFLLGTPIIFGAALLEAHKITPDQLNAAFAAGLAASLITGLAQETHPRALHCLQGAAGRFDNLDVLGEREGLRPGNRAASGLFGLGLGRSAYGEGDDYPGPAAGLVLQAHTPAVTQRYLLADEKPQAGAALLFARTAESLHPRLQKLLRKAGAVVRYFRNH